MLMNKFGRIYTRKSRHQSINYAHKAEVLQRPVTQSALMLKKRSHSGGSIATYVAVRAIRLLLVKVFNTDGDVNIGPMQLIFLMHAAGAVFPCHVVRHISLF